MKRAFFPCFLLFPIVAFAFSTRSGVSVSRRSASHATDTLRPADALGEDTTLQPVYLTGEGAALVDSLFATAPREVLPMLDRTARLDLLDLANHRMKAVAENVYGGRSMIEEKTPEGITVVTSEAGRWEMTLLSRKGETTVFVIRSVTAGGTSSRLRAFTTDWRVRKAVVPAPPREAFYTLPAELSADRRDYLRDLLQRVPVKMSFSATDRLFLSLDTEGLAKEDKETAEAICRPLAYEWTGEEFLLVKP